MNRILPILIAVLIAPIALAQELATYNISTSIEGMTVPDQLPGVGDRSLSFDLKIDPNDMDAANEVYYSHLEILLGPDQVAAMRANARQMGQGRRR